jgi:hypothetical protein
MMNDEWGMMNFKVLIINPLKFIMLHLSFIILHSLTYFFLGDKK